MIRLILNRPWTAIIAVAIFTVCALLFTAFKLEVHHGILDLYDRDDPSQVEYRRYIDHFGTTEDLVVVAEGKDPVAIRSAIDTLADRLSPRTDLIRYLYYRLNRRDIESRALYFISSEKRADLGKALRDPEGPLHALLFAQKPTDFFLTLAHQIKTGTQTSENPSRDLKRLTGLFTTFQQAAEGEVQAPEAWRHFLEEDRPDPRLSLFDEAGYLRAEKGLYLLFIRPQDTHNDTEESKRLVALVRQELAALKPQFPGISAGVTGAPALNADQFKVAQEDMNYASFFSLIAISVLFFISFHEMIRPLLSVLALGVGIAWAFGWTTLTVGHLNLFSLPFALMLIGLGTDFSIHFVARYELERLEGKPCREALIHTFHEAGKGLAVGAITTSIAFWTTLLVDLKGFAELGWIAGSGILLCLISTFIALPPLLYLRDRRRGAFRVKKLRVLSPLMQRWGRLLSQHRKIAGITTFCIIAIATVLIFSPAAPLRFDYNLLNLQADGTEAVAYEYKLLESRLTPRTAIWLPDPELSEAAIDQKIAEFSALPSVARVESLRSLEPAHPEDAVRELAPLAAYYPVPSPLSRADLSDWQAALKELKTAMNTVAEKTFRSGKRDLFAIATESIETINRWEQALAIQGENASNAYAKDFFASVRGFFHTALHATPIAFADYPLAIQERFRAKDGSQAVYIVPEGSIWNREELVRFVQETRSVEPRVTGNPLQMLDTLDRVRIGYTKSALYALIAIFCISLLSLRRLKEAAIATSTVMSGLLLLFGAMSALQIPFNMANLIAVPMIIGMAIDNSIHLLFRFRENPNWDLAFRDTGKAISFSTFTNLLGFGGMALSRHHGLASMGQILIIGVSFAFLTAITLLPLLMREPEARESAPAHR